MRSVEEDLPPSLSASNLSGVSRGRAIRLAWHFVAVRYVSAVLRFALRLQSGCIELGLVRLQDRALHCHSADLFPGDPSDQVRPLPLHAGV